MGYDSSRRKHAFSLNRHPGMWLAVRAPWRWQHNGLRWAKNAWAIVVDGGSGKPLDTGVPALRSIGVVPQVSWAASRGAALLGFLTGGGFIAMVPYRSFRAEPKK